MGMDMSLAVVFSFSFSLLFLTLSLLSFFSTVPCFPSIMRSKLRRDLSDFFLTQNQAQDSSNSTTTSRHEACLETLSSILQDWKRALGPAYASSTTLSIYPFGSVCLGSDLSFSDLDVICISQKNENEENEISSFQEQYITRDVFFQYFPSFLSQHPSIAGLQVIREAHTPVIKCVFESSLEVDLIFLV